MNPKATASWLSPDEARAQMRRWATNPLQVRRAEVATIVGLDGETRQYPLVTVVDRPDLRDFIRRHALDGEGDGSFEWKALMHPAMPSFAAIRCQFTAPVKKVFSIEFNMRQHLDFLRAVALHNLMALTVELPFVIYLAPCGMDLRDMLSVFALGELLHRGQPRG